LNIGFGNVNQGAVGAYETTLNNSVTKQKSALRIMLESQKSSKRDTLSIPNNTKIFTKDGIAYKVTVRGSATELKNVLNSMK